MIIIYCTKKMIFDPIFYCPCNILDLGSVWLVIPNLPNSENGRFGETEAQFPIKYKLLQSSKFQIYPCKNKVSCWKIQRQIWCLAAKSKLTDYHSNLSRVALFLEFCKWNRESLQSLPNLLPFGAEGSEGLTNLLNLSFLELGSQSNTNSESSISTVFRIGTNQTYP